MKLVTHKPYAQIEAEVFALDLDPIKVKLMDKDEGEGWSREEVDLVETQYRRFLLLTATTAQTVSPTREIDLFWHAHILDTMKYHADCEALFGRYLHHFPYFGMRGAQDAEDLHAAFEETRRLWEARYGEPLRSVLDAATNCNSCGSNSCSNCSSNCVGSKCSGLFETTRGAPLAPLPGGLQTHWRPRLAPALPATS